MAGVAQAQCVAQNMAVLNPGAYGALTPHAFELLKEALLAGERDRLNALVAQNLVVSLAPGKAVCILRVAFDQHCKLVQVPGLPLPYWVADEAFSTPP